MTRLGDDASISYGLLCEPNIYVSRSTSELRVRLVLLNMLKPSSNSLPAVSFVDPFCYLLFHVCLCYAVLFCLFLAALWSPAGEWADLLALLCVIFSCVLSLSHMVSWFRWVDCIFAFFFTFKTRKNQKHIVLCCLVVFAQYMIGRCKKTLSIIIRLSAA